MNVMTGLLSLHSFHPLDTFFYSLTFTLYELEMINMSKRAGSGSKTLTFRGMKFLSIYYFSIYQNLFYLV